MVHILASYDLPVRSYESRSLHTVKVVTATSAIVCVNILTLFQSSRIKSNLG